MLHLLLSLSKKLSQKDVFCEWHMRAAKMATFDHCLNAQTNGWLTGLLSVMTIRHVVFYINQNISVWLQIHQHRIHAFAWHVCSDVAFCRQFKCETRNVNFSGEDYVFISYHNCDLTRIKEIVHPSVVRWTWIGSKYSGQGTLKGNSHSHHGGNSVTCMGSVDRVSRWSFNVA